MFEIVKKLDESNIVEKVEIIEMVDEQSIKMLKLKAELRNRTILYIHELHTKKYQKYSYHWQNKDGKLFLRWDNSPHHKELPNFPYHLHKKSKIESSFRVEIDDVLSEIRNLL